MEKALVLLNILFGLVTIVVSLFALGVLYESKFTKKIPFIVLALVGVLTLANVRKVAYIMAKEFGQIQDHDIYVYVEDLDEYEIGDAIEFPLERDVNETLYYDFITYEDDGVVKPINKNTSTSMTLDQHFKGKDKLSFIKNEEAVYNIENQRQNLRIILTNEDRFNPEAVIFR